MTYRGHVQGGVIILDEKASLSDGTQVVVEVATPSNEPAVGEELAKLAGLAKGAPG